MFIHWSEAFEIGVPRIDGQHRSLVDLVNEFHEACGRRESRSLVYPVLNRLCRYAEEHFRDEEALMEAARYPDLLRQRRQHDALTQEIFALDRKYEAGDAAVTDETLDFLKSWLLDHILQSDRKMGDYVRARGIPEPWATEGNIGGVGEGIAPGGPRR